MLEVKDKKTLLSLKNHEENELVKVLEEDKTYQYLNGEWTEYKAPEINISLYDINKQFYNTKDDLDDFGLTEGQAKITQYIKEHKGKYYMLLNNELHYYTIFEVDCEDGEATIEQELMNLLKYFDNVKAFEQAPGAIEIWATLEGELGCFMFFDYTEGVIRCN